MTALDIAVALIVLAALVGAAWMARGAIRAMREPDYRTRNDHLAAQRITRFEARPEAGTPGSDQQLLDACWAIYATTDQARKETP